jgi:hypothetical protein
MPTLTLPSIARANIKAFRTLFPFIFQSGIDFSDVPLKLGKKATAHIRVLPTLAAYDANNGGYKNGAVQGRSLLKDVDILIDQHNHVPVEYAHLDLLKDQKASWDGAMEDQAFVLGRGMADSFLAKVRGSSISRKVVEAAGNADLDTLEGITTIMNEAGAGPGGRIGVVNSSVAQSLGLDSRIASKDFYGSLTGGQAYRKYTNVGGFKAIYEYPSLSANNAPEKDFTATAASDLINCVGHGFLNGDRVRVTTSAADLPAGLAIDTDYYVRDATADTFKVALTDGGAVVDITDAGTGTHKVRGYENLTGFFWEPSAVAFKAGIPADSHKLAAALGIPQTMAMDVVTDPETGFSLAMMKWMEAGTADIYVSPTCLYGSCVGRQGGAANDMTDRGGVRLVAA